MMAAVLWYNPSARFSNSEATTTTPSSAARAPRRSVLGPGIGSARSKNLWSSIWQKYWLRKSSWRQTICAPRAAASRMPATAVRKLASGSSPQRDWTRPSVTRSRVGGAMGRKITGGRTHAMPESPSGSDVTTVTGRWKDRNDVAGYERPAEHGRQPWERTTMTRTLSATLTIAALLAACGGDRQQAAGRSDSAVTGAASPAPADTAP